MFQKKGTELIKSKLYAQLDSEIEVYALASGEKRNKALKQVFTTAIEILKVDLQKDGINDSAILTQDHKNRIEKLITTYHFASQKVKAGVSIIIADQYEMIKNITKVLDQITCLLPNFEEPCKSYDEVLPLINQVLKTYVEGCLHTTHKPLAKSENSQSLYQQLLLATSALREQNIEADLPTIKKSVLGKLIQFATTQQQSERQSCSERN